MFGRILLPLDGSKAGEAIIPYAAQVARALGSPLTLFHASGGGRSRGPEYLQRTAEGLRAQGLSVETASVRGKPAAAIVRYAEKEGFHLIAMSTRGRSGLNRLAYGSVADRVLHGTETPLLLISPQEQAAAAPLQGIVVPLDGSPLSEAALPIAETLGSALGLGLTLVRAVSEAALSRRALGASPHLDYPGPLMDPPEYAWELAEHEASSARTYLEQHQGPLAHRGLQVGTQVLHGPPAPQLVALMQDAPNRLLVMCTRGRSGVGRWVLGSVADQVLRSSGRPVLVIRPTLPVPDDVPSDAGRPDLPRRVENARPHSAPPSVRSPAGGGPEGPEAMAWPCSPACGFAPAGRSACTGGT